MTALDYVPRKQKACRRGIVEVLREEQATVVFGDYSADIEGLLSKARRIHFHTKHKDYQILPSSKDVKGT